MKREQMRVAGLILAVLVAAFAIRWFGRPEDSKPTTKSPKERGSTPDEDDRSPSPQQPPAPKYPGKPLTEKQARQVIEAFARIRVPDVPLAEFASGVEPERLGTRGIISFVIDPALIPPVAAEFRNMATALVAATGKEYYFSEVISSSSLRDVRLDDSTHKFKLTSQENRLVLPEETSKALGLEPERYTKDF
jgi:hypothetical protein